MEIRSHTPRLTAILWIAAAIALYPFDSQAKAPFSQANTILFLSDHLQGITPPATLYYAFEKSGSQDGDFQDSIEIRVTKAHADGSHSVEMQYLSGDRERYVPPVENAHGNPIIMLFLQRDVMDMHDQAHRGWRYFQKLIKLALQDSATIHPVSIPFEGELAKGEQVRIQPYLDFPEGGALARYRHKTYLFTLADGIPGTVYELKTINEGGSEEVLRYTGDRPAVEGEDRRATAGAQGS